MKANSLVLTLGLALATTYGLGQTGSQGGQYPSSQAPTTQQQPSTEQAPSNTADQSGQQTRWRGVSLARRHTHPAPVPLISGR